MEHRNIIADHIRSAVMIINDGVYPAAKGRGYILRRLIRRSLRSSLALNIDISNREYFKDLVLSVVSIYLDVYEIDTETQTRAIDILVQESVKYNKAILVGNKEWAKILNSQNKVDYENETWNLYQSHGVPLELSESVLESNGIVIDKNKLNGLIVNHQQISNTTEKGDFKSGLINNSDLTVGMHTTTHILHKVLIDTYGDGVRQMGSAITNEKARFDFSCNEDVDVVLIENKVNSILEKSLIMTSQEMSPTKAKSEGAIGLFGEKYGETVSVYTLRDVEGNVFSKEFCTGPHIQNTNKITKFKILKLKSLGQGVKRLEFLIDLV